MTPQTERISQRRVAEREWRTQRYVARERGTDRLTQHQWDVCVSVFLGVVVGTCIVGFGVARFATAVMEGVEMVGRWL